MVRDTPGHPWGPGATSTATWTGARLADVLQAAGVDADAAHVAFEAPDIAAVAQKAIASVLVMVLLLERNSVGRQGLLRIQAPN